MNHAQPCHLVSVTHNNKQCLEGECRCTCTTTTGTNHAQICPGWCTCRTSDESSESTTISDSWEERFDQEFDSPFGDSTARSVRAFIHQELSLAHEKGRKEGIAQTNRVVRRIVKVNRNHDELIKSLEDAIEDLLIS